VGGVLIETGQIRNVVVAPITGQPGVSFVTLYSPALRRRADITLFIPPGQENQPLPLLILMHGVYGSHWNWSVLGNVPDTAREMIREGSIEPFAIAMPSDGLWGDGSGYVVHREFNAELWIMDDVPSCVRSIAPELQGGPLFLGGQSMGGFGALRLGAKYASRVAGISAHSPVTCLADLMQHVQQPEHAFEAAGKRDTDILYWIRRHRAQLPPIRMDCGTADALLEANRVLHGRLLKERIPHTYQENPGGHDWAYWQQYVRATLQFVSRIAYAEVTEL
jgi:putative tributyrin esterase